MTGPLISIILPIYNQADHIRQVLDEYDSALQQLSAPSEVILVPNGCKDRSIEICESFAKQHRSFQVVPGPKAGWGAAVRLGIQTSQGQVICYTNSARTSAQNLILLLVYALTNPNVVIKANRKIRQGWFRRLGSLLFNLECRALFDFPQWDINGTPKVFPRKFHKLLQLQRDDDLIDTEFNIICRREDYPIMEIPIISVRRAGGKSTTNIGCAIKLYWGAVSMWHDQRK